MADDSPTGSPRVRWSFPGPSAEPITTPPSPDKTLLILTARAKKSAKCLEVASECYTQLQRLHDHRVIDERSLNETKCSINDLLAMVDVKTAPDIATAMNIVFNWLKSFDSIKSQIHLHLDMNIARHASDVTRTGGCYIGSAITLDEAKKRLNLCRDNIVALAARIKPREPLCVLSVSPANAVCGIGHVCLQGRVSQEVEALLHAWIADVNKFKHEHSTTLRESHSRIGHAVTDASIFTAPPPPLLP